MAIEGVKQNASTDRIIVLETVDKKQPLSSTGMVDTRLFTGENKLHAVRDNQTCLWHFKYDMGVLPQPLKQQFTGFKALLKFAEDYFKKRNIRVTEVMDHYGSQK